MDDTHKTKYRANLLLNDDAYLGSLATQVFNNSSKIAHTDYMNRYKWKTNSTWLNRKICLYLGFLFVMLD